MCSWHGWESIDLCNSRKLLENIPHLVNSSGKKSKHEKVVNINYFSSQKIDELKRKFSEKYKTEFKHLR